jgi:hypothetical protein
MKTTKKLGRKKKGGVRALVVTNNAEALGQAAIVRERQEVRRMIIEIAVPKEIRGRATSIVISNYLRRLHGSRAQ